MTKKKMVLALLVLFSLIAGIWLYIRFSTESYYKQFTDYSGKAKIDDYEMIADGAGIITHWKSTDPKEDRLMREYGSYYYFDPIRVGSKHILHMNVKFRENFYYRTTPPEKDEYWTVSVYKVNGERLKEEKELDLFKVVEQFDPDYIPTELGSVYSWNGRELVSLQIRSTKDNSVRKMMYLNLDTRKLERNETLENDHQRKPIPDFNVPIDREKSSIEELKFFKNWFSIDPKDLSKTQFKKSSKAYKLLNQKDTKVIVIKPQNSADQYARSIAVFELFMKKGVNLYQDVTIPAELSRDGQTHTTQTKEEFDHYYDLEKAHKVYNEID
ncbi:MAG: hypothetical protein E7K53_03980 [Streptococcus parasanguinis]|jgi:hypothetical protein|uniref:hypothetical protein n=1 Tax=Streptococcus TaxID=1301 RepID=UPI001CD999DA|nr:MULTISPECIES: hypothetical protein [Streptococcus]MCP9068347.1 hypothetical protein [Streptococcus parasanguinis]MDU7552823.1 hypothetical protein [Streptococcus parasanguinis]